MNQLRVHHLRTNLLISQIISRQAPIWGISETQFSHSVCKPSMPKKIPKTVPISTEFDLRFYRYVKCIGKNRKSFRFEYWNQHFILSKYLSRFEIHNFNIWIHFKKASRYADLGIPLKHWPMAEPKASRNLFVTTFQRFAPLKWQLVENYAELKACVITVWDVMKRAI